MKSPECAAFAGSSQARLWLLSPQHIDRTFSCCLHMFTCALLRLIDAIPANARGALSIFIRRGPLFLVDCGNIVLAVIAGSLNTVTSLWRLIAGGADLIMKAAGFRTRKHSSSFMRRNSD